jgi:hypothetical protein
MQVFDMFPKATNSLGSISVYECGCMVDIWASTESRIENQTNGFLIRSRVYWLRCMLRQYDMWLVACSSPFTEAVPPRRDRSIRGVYTLC